MAQLSSKSLEFMYVCKNIVQHQAGEVHCAGQGWESLSLFTDTFHAAYKVFFSQCLLCLKVKILANETHKKNTFTLTLSLFVYTLWWYISLYKYTPLLRRANVLSIFHTLKKTAFYLKSLLNDWPMHLPLSLQALHCVPHSYITMSVLNLLWFQ